MCLEWFFFQIDLHNKQIFWMCCLFLMSHNFEWVRRDLKVLFSRFYSNHCSINGIIQWIVFIMNWINEMLLMQKKEFQVFDEKYPIENRNIHWNIESTDFTLSVRFRNQSVQKWIDTWKKGLVHDHSEWFYNNDPNIHR